MYILIPPREHYVQQEKVRSTSRLGGEQHCSDELSSQIHQIVSNFVFNH